MSLKSSIAGEAENARDENWQVIPTADGLLKIPPSEECDQIEHFAEAFRGGFGTQQKLARRIGVSSSRIKQLVDKGRRVLLRIHRGQSLFSPLEHLPPAPKPDRGLLDLAAKIVPIVCPNPVVVEIGPAGPIAPFAPDADRADRGPAKAGTPSPARARVRGPSKGPVVVVKSGSVRIPIYRRKDDNFEAFWKEDGRTRHVVRANFDRIKEAAKLAAEAMSNGETFMAGMLPEDRATLTCVRNRLAGTGHSPESAAAVVHHCEERLRKSGCGFSIEGAVDRAIEAELKNRVVPMDVPALVESFLEARRRNTWGRRKTGVRCLQTYESQGRIFAGYFKCQAAALTSGAMNEWLDSMAIGSRTRKGYRIFLSVLFAYARDKNFLPESWSELRRIHVGSQSKVAKPILAPAELIRLLYFAENGRGKRTPFIKMLPFIFMQSFAGIRHEELNGWKEVLQWEDVDVDNRVIHVRPEVSKTGEERFVRITDNLLLWILKYRLASGPVCEVSNTSAALGRLKRAAGLKSGRNETRNCLRKSWETYATALQENPLEVAAEAGHSAAVAKAHYVKQQRTKDAALKWFAVKPYETEGVLDLFAGQAVA